MTIFDTKFFLAEMFCGICSYLSILHEQGNELLSALDRTLAGHPVLPAFS